MIPYFTPIIPGELFYSALARSLRLYPENSSTERQRSWLLGSAYRRFGVLLPAHGQHLLSQIPTSLGLNEDHLMAASLHPAVAPFLETTERMQLWHDCIHAEKPQLQGWFVRRAKRPPVFKYCPTCAQEDVAAGRPRHWRSVHQHPNVFACPHHGTALVQLKDAPLATPRVLFPGDWIDVNCRKPRAAHPLECFVACALLWLLEENTSLPGGSRLKRAMVSALRASPRNAAAGRLRCHAQLLENMASGTDLPCRRRNDLNLSSVKSWVKRFTSKTSTERNFSRYACACYALGISFQELFAAAMALPDESGTSSPAEN